MSTTPAPVAIAQTAVEAAEEALAAAERAQQRLSSEVSRFIGRGEPGDVAGRVLWREQLQAYHDQAAQLKAETDDIRVVLQAAKERRDRAARELDSAERAVNSLRTRADEAERQRLRHQLEADSCQRARDQALADLVEAEARLAVLKPRPAPMEAIATPAPAATPELAYPLPARTVFDFGQSRFFDSTGREVARDGGPLPG